MVYGARLESVLGASPQEFESLILRKNKNRLRAVFVFADHKNGENTLSSGNRAKREKRQNSFWLFRVSEDFSCVVA